MVLPQGSRNITVPWQSCCGGLYMLSDGLRQVIWPWWNSVNLSGKYLGRTGITWYSDSRICIVVVLAKSWFEFRTFTYKHNHPTSLLPWEAQCQVHILHQWPKKWSWFWRAWREYLFSLRDLDQGDFIFPHDLSLHLGLNMFKGIGIQLLY